MVGLSIVMPSIFKPDLVVLGFAVLGFAVLNHDVPTFRRFNIWNAPKGKIGVFSESFVFDMITRLPPSAIYEGALCQFNK